MKQTQKIPTGMLPNMDELRDAAAMLQKIRRDTSTVENSLALDDIADKLIQLANTVERRMVANVNH
ncbi:hypothetical protein [Halodesulfovibrio marinisediminis]|uniref:Uncharacterized protein n=1 Tax=Halodesulfovibrio marinisediminis DSM 17456 TaxID=1121457 RepID=A0A1N6I017_9BACT|nr:hypothetical protein [Halodesulfovibrio marinisediminis]SIO25259.1 hypothetical protein SAMN02745161_2306 [Halodesulfovibrio marinisediminis DSM 17456]